MNMFFFKKSIMYCSLIFSVILFSFLMFHAVPSDPARLILGPNASTVQVSALQKELGLDKPLHVQFADYVIDIFKLNFGRSFIDNRPVWLEVSGKFRVSLFLVIVSMIITVIYSLFAIHMLYKAKDIRNFNFFLISTPTFFSGLFIALMSIKFFPFSSFNGQFNSYKDFLFFIPPAFALATYPMGVLTNILVKELKVSLASKYILAAKAYGISGTSIYYKYALKNAIIPYFAALSNQLPALFTGAFILEIIFSIPGAGSLLVKSIFARDFPMMEGIIIINGTVFIIINLFFETVYPLIDPRIRS
jgi:peptide/nickel transport system permease protein